MLIPALSKPRRLWLRPTFRSVRRIEIRRQRIHTWLLLESELHSLLRNTQPSMDVASRLVCLKAEYLTSCYRSYKPPPHSTASRRVWWRFVRSEEHTSELQSR